MIRSTLSFYFSICVLTVGAVCFLGMIHPKIDSVISFDCEPHISGAPVGLEKALFETKRIGEECLENYESCAFEKAECLGRQSFQDTTLQKYSVLLSEYKMILKGSLSGKTMERIPRPGIDTNPRRFVKFEKYNGFSISTEFRATYETQQDLVHRVQSRDNILCRERYVPTPWTVGVTIADCLTDSLSPDLWRFSVGPYYVKCTFSTGHGSDEQATVIIEIPSRLYLPHTVLTFLTLVDAGQYSASTVTLSPTILSIEANLFDNSRKDHGLTRPVLGFVESSDKFPCKQNSVGFMDYGPHLMIFLENSDVKNRTCFGRVVRGIESLQILDAQKESTTHVDSLQILHL